MHTCTVIKGFGHDVIHVGLWFVAPTAPTAIHGLIRLTQKTSLQRHFGQSYCAILRMNAAIVCYSLVLCLSGVYSAIMPTPAMQRKSTGDSCTFRWNVTGNNFTSYSIKLLSSGNPTTLGLNTNQTFDSSKGVIKLFIWNIQTSNAGYYSLSLTSEVNSTAALFVYAIPSAYTSFTAGRNPCFGGDRIESNCSATSNSFPVEFRTKTYITWCNSFYGGCFRSISSGPVMLQNGDVLPGYSIKNDGKTFVIDSAQYADTSLYCSVKEEGSSYYGSLYFGLSGLQIYSKPYAYSFYPASRKINSAVPYQYVNLYFYYQATPPLTSYTNWTLIDASGKTVAYPMQTGYNPLISNYVPISSYLNSYGNISVTLTNSNGSTTTTFQVLPQGPPDTPTDCSVQYVTHSLVSLQWRCRWFNGAQQTVFVQLMDATNDVEVEIQAVTLALDCYNSAFSTLFQNNILPERDYEASIWSVNTIGSSNVVNFALRTSKRIIFETSPANISITGSQAIINFIVTDSAKAMLWLNVTCCVELTAQCSNQSYSITVTDNRIVYDALPDGTEYVFEFLLYDSDGFTYMSTLAIIKGVRASRTGYVDPAKCPPQDGGQQQCIEKENLLVAVIVMAVLLGVAVLVLLGCVVALLVGRFRQNDSHNQQSATVPRPSTPTRSNAKTREPSGISSGEDLYEPVVDLALSKEGAYYKTLELPAGTDKQSSGASRTVISHDQEDTYENVRDDVFQTKSNGTLDKPKKNRYQ